MGKSEKSKKSRGGESGGKESGRCRGHESEWNRTTYRDGGTEWSPVRGMDEGKMGARRKEKEGPHFKLKSQCSYGTRWIECDACPSHTLAPFLPLESDTERRDVGPTPKITREDDQKKKRGSSHGWVHRPERREANGIMDVQELWSRVCQRTLERLPRQARASEGRTRQVFVRRGHRIEER